MAIARVQMALERGADPNCGTHTPLMLAVRAWLPQLVAMLLGYGGDVHARNDFGRTPLLEAFIYGVPDTVTLRMLLDAGSDVRAIDSSGNSVLHFVIGPHLDLIKMLIDAGADVNAVNIMGDTPLCNALQHGGDVRAAMLVAAGARPCPYDSGGNPADLVTLDRDSTSWTGIRLPCDLDDAVGSLHTMLHPRFKAHVGISPESVLTGMHLGFGMWLRNNWGLWGESPLACWFQSIGVRHPDDMSSIILSVFRRDLRGEQWLLRDEVERAARYWSKMDETETVDD